MILLVLGHGNPEVCAAVFCAVLMSVDYAE
jgi:hypothetical protein